MIYCERNKKNKTKITGRAVYMEIFRENKTAYRVTSGQIQTDGKQVNIYGIETEDYRTGSKESIDDFSEKLEDAVAFAEYLAKTECLPENIYVKALGFLCVMM